MDARQLRIALNAAPITRGALCLLAREIDAWRDAGEGDAPALAARLGVPAEPLRRALGAARRGAGTAERELARAARAGVEIVTLGEDAYPRRLLDLALPPPVLYCHGRLDHELLDAGAAVAMVGARKMTPYGREAAECFASRLAAAGVLVVSGFARGVDSVSHRAALGVAGGRTLAVLGCGLDVDYPRGQGELKAAIAERGAVISEFPFGAEPRRWHFPIRNRVIAALTSATLVVEAKLRSGSLITAHHALELGRDVWAVPGRVFDETALGTNGLLADGALVARAPEDLLEGLSFALPGRQAELFSAPAAIAGPSTSPITASSAAAPRARPTGLAGKIIDALPEGSRVTAEDLAGRLEKKVEPVLGALLELELQGWVRREPGPVYVR